MSYLTEPEETVELSNRERKNLETKSCFSAIYATFPDIKQANLPPALTATNNVSKRKHK